MFEALLERLVRGTIQNTGMVPRTIKEGETIYLMAFPASKGEEKTLLGIDAFLSAIEKTRPQSIYDPVLGEALGKTSWNIGLMPTTLTRLHNYYFAVSPGDARYANALITEPTSETVYHDYTNRHLYTWGIKNGDEYLEVYELEYVIYRALNSEVCMDALFPFFIRGVEQEFSLDKKGRELFIKTCLLIQQELTNTRRVVH